MNHVYLTYFFWLIISIGCLIVLVTTIRSTLLYLDWKRTKQSLGANVELAESVISDNLRLKVLFPNSSPPSCEALLQTNSQANMLIVLDGYEPYYKNLDELIKIGCALTIHFAAKSALYEMECKLKDIISSEKSSPKLITSRPRWISKIQRREHVRANVDIPGTLQIYPVTVDHLPLHTNLVNLSGNGFNAFVFHNGPISILDKLLIQFVPNTIVELRLPIPILSSSRLAAKIVTAEKATIAGGIAISVRAQFVSLHAWEEDVLVQCVFKSQFQSLKRLPMSSILEI